MINYDDFKKVEMKAGTIVSAEIVEGADKLYKFMVNLGEDEPRQILSAIREFFPDPEFFPGKQFMFVTNLEPRTIRGLESNGMILAVDDAEGNPMFVTPKETVPNGSAMR
jgi:methionyl-tRNA synthetase